MTEPTTNPILEKMARAHYQGRMAGYPRALGNVPWDDLPPWQKQDETEAVVRALRSLLPLDEEGVSSAAASLSMAPFPSQRSKTSAKRTLTAFINHAIGGK